MWSPNELLKTEKQRDILSYITLQFFPFKKVPLEHYPKEKEAFRSAWLSLVADAGLTGSAEQFLYEGFAFCGAEPFYAYLIQTEDQNATLAAMFSGKYYGIDSNVSFRLVAHLLALMLNNNAPRNILAPIIKRLPGACVNKDKKRLGTAEKTFEKYFLAELHPDVELCPLADIGTKPVFIKEFVLCVENKVFSGEHNDQLRRYRDTLLEEYPGYTMSFAFLSPDGIAPLSADDQQYWQPVGYADILDAIESAKGGSALLPEVNMLLDHYAAAVRRHIVGDENIKKLCQDFYDRHKEILDTIYENCKTSLNPICEAVEDWCKEKSEKGELIFSSQWSNNTYTRFTTMTIRKLFPQHTKPISGWKTTDMAFYEIIKRENYFKIALSLCSDNLTDAQRMACDRVSQALNRPDKKEDWRWKRIQNWPRHTIESEPDGETYKEEIYRCLNANWQEIQKFESDLINRIK